MLSHPEKIDFQGALLAWFAQYKRDLPWRRVTDPYAIWISEIMLQQTRVAAAIPFYERFLERFPDLETLAAASESDLLAHWAGLGYYYRARNLQKAARQMCEAGCFPETYDGIRALPGVGEYTTAAVGSIAFGLPCAVVDGNVLRVLSRIFADGTDIASAAGRRHFSAMADELLCEARAGEFNQAMMELGATVCLRRNPQCLICPAGRLCQARQAGRQNEFPVKSAVKKSVEEQRVLFWIAQGEQILLWRRPEASRLMPGFWELPERTQLPDTRPESVLGSFRHSITHHRYQFQVCRAAIPDDCGDCRWVDVARAREMPLSTIARKAQKIAYSRENCLSAGA